MATGPWQNASDPPYSHHVPYAAGAVPKCSQTWYDDAKSTQAKVAAAKAFELGGVGVFTGEGVGVGPPAAAYWAALLGSAGTPGTRTIDRV